MAVTNASARQQLPPGAGRLRLTNLGTAAIHVRLGDDTVAATTDHVAIAPGCVLGLAGGNRGETWLAGISPDAGPHTLQVTRASGGSYD